MEWDALLSKNAPDRLHIPADHGGVSAFLSEKGVDVSASHRMDILEQYYREEVGRFPLSGNYLCNLL